MPDFEGRYHSIIFVGKQNPQILNHDFLINNKILPIEQEPFKGLIYKKDAQPFTEFISTPLLTSIKYDYISITVEVNRYQITNSKFNTAPSSFISQITKKYFGECLRHTPLRLGGMNLNGIIKFDNGEDEQSFDESLGIIRKNLSKIVSTNDIRTGVIFSFPWENGVIETKISKPKDRTAPASINLNYEFEYKDIVSFLKNLDDFEKMYTEFTRFLDSLNVRTA